MSIWLRDLVVLFSKVSVESIICYTRKRMFRTIYSVQFSQVSMYWGCLVNMTCLAIQGFTQKCQCLVCFLIKCFTRKECPVAKFSLQGWTNLSVPSLHCYKQTLGEWIRAWMFKMEKETLLSIVCEFWPCTVKNTQYWNTLFTLFSFALSVTVYI